MFSWFPNNFKHSQNHLSKTKHASPLPVTEPARSSTWRKTKENTGLVVVLPKTYSQTLSHTAAISRASHPAARSSTWVKTKENTGLVVVLPRTYPQTLSHTAAISRASHPAARSNTLEKTKENTVLVVALPRTYSLSVTNIWGKLKITI